MNESSIDRTKQHKTQVRTLAKEVMDFMTEHYPTVKVVVLLTPRWRWIASPAMAQVIVIIEDHVEWEAGRKLRVDLSIVLGVMYTRLYDNMYRYVAGSQRDRNVGAILTRIDACVVMEVAFLNPGLLLIRKHESSITTLYGAMMSGVQGLAIQKAFMVVLKLHETLKRREPAEIGVDTCSTLLTFFAKRAQELKTAPPRDVTNKRSELLERFCKEVQTSYPVFFH